MLFDPAAYVHRVVDGIAFTDHRAYPYSDSVGFEKNLVE
jgi:hypothetical protein